MENKYGRNRKSPSNEEMYIKEYMKKNPNAKKNDGYDVSAVITKNGIPGHGLLKEEINRSHNKNYHIVKDFIPDSDLKKKK